ncbi:MAG: hypothetical protein KDK64_02675 [Chlamydiia bacterium]|nr:hypothetical protein [Chlamydiia bacterium]
MKPLLAFLLLGTTALFAIEYETPHPAAGSTTPKEYITPNAGPGVDHGIDAFITGDFIYWTARADNLAYIKTGVGNAVTSVGKGSAKYPNWDWNPGFKAGIGLNLPHDSWNVYAEYTWFYSSASGTTRARGNGMLPTWDIANITSFSIRPDTITQAQGEWDIHFYAIDVSLGRNFFISRFLTLRPFVGFKGSWIDQDYKVRYALENLSTTTSLRMENDQDFWGVGLCSGIETAWHIDPSWSLYGNLALSALWSQFEVHRKDIRTDSRNAGGNNNPPLNTPVTFYNSNNNFHTLKGILEFGMGLRAQWWLFENRYHFLIQAGWEEQLWINQNNFDKSHFVMTNHGDLLLQGLTIKLRFDF